MATTILALKNDYADGDALAAAWLNEVADELEYARFGYVEIDAAGTGDLTPSITTEANRKVLRLTGILTGNRTVLLPANAGQEWLIANDTTGSFTLTVKVSGQTGFAITQGYRARVKCNGTDLQRGSVDFTDAGGVNLTGPVSSPVATVQNLATGNTITLPTGGNSKRLSASGGAVTGVILTAGTLDGQELTLINIEATNTVTFAAAATSNVADGASAVIAALRAVKFTWDSVSARWYRGG